MKPIKKIIFSLIITLSLTFSAADVFPIVNTATTVEAATIKLNKKKATLIKEQTLTLKVSGTKTKVKWSSIPS